MAAKVGWKMDVFLDSTVATVGEWGCVALPVVAFVGELATHSGGVAVGDAGQTDVGVSVGAGYPGAGSAPQAACDSLGLREAAEAVEAGMRDKAEKVEQ